MAISSCRVPTAMCFFPFAACRSSLSQPDLSVSFLYLRLINELLPTRDMRDLQPLLTCSSIPARNRDCVAFDLEEVDRHARQFIDLSFRRSIDGLVLFSLSGVVWTCLSSLWREVLVTCQTYAYVHVFADQIINSIRVEVIVIVTVQYVESCAWKLQTLKNELLSSSSDFECY